MTRDMDGQERLLVALRHPLRRTILKALSASDPPAGSPSEISDQLREPLSNVSYHVRVLADCEAIRLVRTHPVRGSLQHFYELSEEFMADPAVAMVLGRRA